MNNLVVGENRLKNIICADKSEKPVRIEKILKAEIINVVKNYFVVDSDEVNLDIMIVNNQYDIQINLKSPKYIFANTFC